MVAQEIGRYAYHIGERSILGSGITQLVPRYIREGLPLDEESVQNEPDDYRVCFAAGKLHHLARFLAGHALLNEQLMSDDYFDYEKGTRSRFQYRWLIAVVDINDTKYSGKHFSSTPYLPSGVPHADIDVYTSHNPISIKTLIEIPPVPEVAIADLWSEGEYTFKMWQEKIKGQDIFRPMPVETDLSEFCLTYSWVRPLELAVLQALKQHEQDPNVLIEPNQ